MFNFINGQYAITVMLYCQADMSYASPDLQPYIENYFEIYTRTWYNTF